MINLNAIWKETETYTGTTGGELPDGKYQCYINEVEMRESKSGNLGISWDFIEQKTKKHIFKWSRLRANEADNFKNDVGWLKKDLKTLDLECESFDLLDSVLRMAIGKYVMIDIVTKNNGYRNIEIVDEYVPDILDEIANGVQDSEEEHIPF